MKLLFLDIDGVLNAHEPLDPAVLCGRLHREKVELLNWILRESRAHIVLSSAWRYIVHRGEMQLAGMDWLLRSHGVISGRLAGITRPDTMMPKSFSGRPEEWPQENERGKQISDFLATSLGMIGYLCTRHVVIDDMDLGITEAGHPFVQTAGSVGLTERDAYKAIHLLSGD